MPSPQRLLWLWAGAFCIAFPLFFYIQADADLWGHTHFGIEYLKTGKLAATDTYSYSFPGRAWTNHEWLSEAAMGLAYLAGGERGLWLLRGFLLLGIFWGLALLLDRIGKNIFLCLCLLTLAAPSLCLFINVRPHSFTYFLILMILLGLEAYRSGHKLGIRLFPFLIMAWVNLHGGFVVGFALIQIGLAELFFFHTANPSQKREIVGIGLGCLAALMVNPYGLHLFSYLFMALTLKREFISEWQNVEGNYWVLYGPAVFFPLASLIFSRKTSRPTHLIFFFISAFASFFNVRFVILASLLGLPVLMEALSSISAKGNFILKRLDKPLASCLLGITFLISFTLHSKQLRAHIQVDSTYYPVQAKDFLKTLDLGPRLALPFQWGEFAIWHLYPRYRVLLDGRYETVYPVPFAERLLGAYEEGDPGPYLESHPDVVLLESQKKIAETLRKFENWREIYRDQTASIFIPVSHPKFKLFADKKLEDAIALKENHSLFPG